jgi:hypothetical protein
MINFFHQANFLQLHIPCLGDVVIGYSNFGRCTFRFLQVSADFGSFLLFLANLAGLAGLAGFI